MRGQEMVMEPCTWVVLGSGDLKAWMVKVNTGPLCERYLVLLKVFLDS